MNQLQQMMSRIVCDCARSSWRDGVRMHQLMLHEDSVRNCACAPYRHWRWWARAPGSSEGDGVRMRQVQLKEMVCACARFSWRRWCAHAPGSAEGYGVPMRQMPDGDGVRMRQMPDGDGVRMRQMPDGDGVRMRQTQLKKMQLTCAGDC